MSMIVSEQADAWFKEWKCREFCFGKEHPRTLYAKQMWFHFESETIDTRITWRDNEAV